jgi:hypothetical protein
VSLVRSIPHTEATIKVGDGAPKLSRRIVRAMTEQLPEARVEVVDERGTTINRAKSRGLTKDQRAAERIAFRKGTVPKGR